MQSDDMGGKDFAAALRQYQWDVRAFGTLAGLLEQLPVQAADVLVLRGAHASVPALLARLRYAAVGAALVWQPWAATAAERAAALDAGVDACAPAGMELLEWDALLRSLCRRARGDAGSWRVMPPGRTLAGPDGERLPLTLRERAFFERLFNAPGHCLHRERFFPAESPDAVDSARRVDVVVSRLRSKARRLNIELPLLAVRGWGYILLPHGVTRTPPVADPS
ncbi:helix-turn-helix domain-containing protein [Achromobacter sp.]|uniref:helix-turn-helix domain-containing protein n=1 Tax=Achromobacter sp. TaxID=134375 RepID=UPI0028AC8862|nr:helix-turn-helix domain-containing protein [Achromobacter sp.]